MGVVLYSITHEKNRAMFYIQCFRNVADKFHKNLKEFSPESTSIYISNMRIKYTGNFTVIYVE